VFAQLALESVVNDMANFLFPNILAGEYDQRIESMKGVRENRSECDFEAWK